MSLLRLLVFYFDIFLNDFANNSEKILLGSPQTIIIGLEFIYLCI